MIDRLKPFFTYLEKISYRGVKPGLERIRRALALLGNPQNKLRVIHIAGTNGKGSVTSLTAQMLAMSGFSVGFSLSPHVHDYRERVQFYAPNEGMSDPQPQFISENELLATHEKLLALIPDDLGLTYFEWNIALVLKFFAAHNFDYVVLETGMGGRWDATNVCNSFLSGITTIGLDHVAELGGTLGAILGEKQEIIKPGSDFLFGSRDEELIHQAQSHCISVGARFHHVDDFKSEWEKNLSPDKNIFQHRPDYFRENFIFVFSLGKILQARGITVCLDEFLRCDEYHLPPARCETISLHPRVIVDGAHNEPALIVLKKFTDTELKGEYDLIFGCLSDRDFLKLAGIISSTNGQNYWARFSGGERTPSLTVYETTSDQLGGEVAALDAKLKEKLKRSSRTILVCGSFYLCSQFQSFWRS